MKALCGNRSRRRANVYAILYTLEVRRETYFLYCSTCCFSEFWVLAEMIRSSGRFALSIGLVSSELGNESTMIFDTVS